MIETAEGDLSVWRRAVGAVMAATMLGAALAACTAQPPPSPPPPASDGGGEAEVALTDLFGTTALIGLWRVSDAEGETADTWLRLASDDATLWRPCGFIMGSWSAVAGELVAGFFAAHEDCVTGKEMPKVDWLADAVTYERDGDGWVLRDTNGGVVARLGIDGAPPPHRHSSPENVEPPEVTSDADARVAAVALPAGLTPADETDLLGRWVPTPAAPNDPYLEVTSDGGWSGSDGCNGGEGRWSVPHPGVLVATGGPMTLAWCEGSGAPTSFGQARAAGFDGDELVLIDHRGDEIGRLVRD
jgi:hypothetical protein